MLFKELIFIAQKSREKNMNNPLPIVFAALLIFIVGIMISRELQTKNEFPQLSQKNNWTNINTDQSKGALTAPIDVKLMEKPDRYVVTVKGKGANLSSIDIKLEGRQLNLSLKTSHAESRTENKEDEYSYQARYQGEFKRSLTLPGPVDKDKMKSTF
ncbi:MAG: Hsp20/alpha crystallin family protein, partial [Methylosarcina sp.]